MGSETPLTDAHLVHLNTFDGRKIGIPDSTLDLCRTLERALSECRRELEERDTIIRARVQEINELNEVLRQAGWGQGEKMDSIKERFDAALARSRSGRT